MFVTLFFFSIFFFGPTQVIVTFYPFVYCGFKDRRAVNIIFELFEVIGLRSSCSIVTDDHLVGFEHYNLWHPNCLVQKNLLNFIFPLNVFPMSFFAHFLLYIRYFILFSVNRYISKTMYGRCIISDKSKYYLWFDMVNCTQNRNIWTRLWYKTKYFYFEALFFT